MGHPALADHEFADASQVIPVFPHGHGVAENSSLGEPVAELASGPAAWIVAMLGLQPWALVEVDSDAHYIFYR